MKVKKIAEIITACILVVIFICTPLYAQTITLTITPTASITPTPDNSAQKLQDINNKISDLQKQVNDAQNQEKTLKTQIDVANNQIELTQLKISANEQQIEEITQDIKTASLKINNLEGSLNKITKVLLKRIVRTYQVGIISPVEAIVSAQSFENYFDRVTYLRLAQQNDKRMLYDTQQTRNDYANQKEIFEGKKKRVEVLKAQLETYNKQLGEEKKNKEDLLAVTQNDENRYQQLLAAAQAEKAAIEGVIASIKLENGTPVTKGQIIAQVGNSGSPYCSTGPHLHFEIRVNGSDLNPQSYLKSGVNWGYNYSNEQIGYYGSVSPSGDWDWPLNETIKINQGYGSHGFAKSFYADGIHHGIDMVSDSSTLIKAPKDGMLYKGTTSCSGVPMNYVAVDHGGGVFSWYWHVQ